MITEVSSDFTLRPSSRGPLVDLAAQERDQLAEKALASIERLPRKYRRAIVCHFKLVPSAVSLSRLARDEGVTRQATSLWVQRGLVMLREHFQHQGVWS